MDGHVSRWTDGWMGGHTNRWVYVMMDRRKMCRHTDRRMEKEGQTDRETEMILFVSFELLSDRLR
jgi:hypothetical protein